MLGLSLVAASGGHSSSRCTGLSLSRPLLLWSTGSRRTGSVVVAHGPRCSAACGIFPDQGSNPCPLHWQADSQPLRHQGSPKLLLFKKSFYYHFNRVLMEEELNLSIQSTPLLLLNILFHLYELGRLNMLFTQCLYCSWHTILCGRAFGND